MLQSSLQVKITEILQTRKIHLPSIENELNQWREIVRCLQNVESSATDLGQKCPDLRSCLDSLQGLRLTSGDVVRGLENTKARFSRDTVNIGVGGAARMGKSTLLQAFTGLSEQQVPTSDKYFTTAIASKVENSEEGIAVADFHDEQSFLEDVLTPMCRAAGQDIPTSIDDFLKTKIKPIAEEKLTQQLEDMSKRLLDAQKAIPNFRKELQGDRGRRIPLPELRSYVAYPDGGISKAGPFLAVKDMSIRVPFPNNNVRQLKIMDLPGLGESGRDLEEVQTRGLSDVCDITLLVKRPTDANVAWTLTDTKALDAMGRAVSALEDKTLYTVILANVGGLDPQRARACIEAIHADVKRPFSVLECNAKDAVSVQTETLPGILAFAAEKLPLMDKQILDRTTKRAELEKERLRRELKAIVFAVNSEVPSADEDDFRASKELRAGLTDSLDDFSKIMESNALKGDAQWVNEIEKTKKIVIEWAKNGCGYDSIDAFKEAIRRAVVTDRGQPTSVVNAVRNGFREQWDMIDGHLHERIAWVLENIVDAIKAKTGSFVPDRIGGTNRLDDVRKQIRVLSEKFAENSSPDQPLYNFSRFVHRLAEVDLTFRFHLEPTLKAATELLLANKLPLVNGIEDVESFKEALLNEIIRKAEEYARAMSSVSQGDDGTKKIDKILRMYIKDEEALKELQTIIARGFSSTQAFIPSRILAAVVETFNDAFIRGKDSDLAFNDWYKHYREELQSKPDPKVLAAKQLLRQIERCDSVANK